ncbi:MAG: FAD-binding oxidoreductase, partial [Candidatus Hodarchaeales archaeon]
LPITEDEIFKLIKYCLQHKIPIIPRGAATSGHGGAIPVTEGIVLDIRGMNKIIELDEENLTVLVESGVIWEDILEYLEERGFTLRCYPSSARSATVGGWVASGGSGIGGLKYGGVKAQVKALEVVLANGEVINTANGITSLGISDDVTKYFIGSNGILGIITKSELLIKAKTSLQKFVITFQSLESLCSCLVELDEQTNPYHIQFMDKEYVNFRILLKEEKLPKDHYICMIVYEDDSDLESNLNKFNEIVVRNKGKILNNEIAEAEWKERFYPMRIKRLGPSLVPSEVCIPLQNLKDFILKLRKNFKNERLGIEGILSSKGNAVAMTYFLDDERKQISFLTGIYRPFEVITIAVEEFGGNVYAIGLWMYKFAERFFGKEYLTELKTLKRNLDPHNIMNPKKVFNTTTRFGIPPFLLFPISLLRLGRKFFPPTRHPIFGILLILIIIIAIAAGISWVLSSFFKINLIDLIKTLLLPGLLPG